MDRRLQAKLRLEAELIRPMGDAIARYIMLWERRDGLVPTMERIAYHDLIARVLERHYARVMLSMQGLPQEAEPTLQQAAPSMVLAERYRGRAHAHAHLILRGINKELAAELVKVEALAEKSADDEIETKKGGKAPFTMSYTVRFKEAAKRAWEKMKKRLKTIANVETQATSEDTTYEWVRQNHANARIVKIWNSLMDGKERPAHHEAHLQEQYVDQPFEVGGALLKFPGDNSLGAPLSQTANCRCWLQFDAVKPDGSRVTLPIETPSLPAKRPWKKKDPVSLHLPQPPTQLVPLRGKTRGGIILGDGMTQATLSQPTPSSVQITINGRAIARADFSGPNVTSMTIAPGYEGQGIENLIRNSVRNEHEWRARQNAR